MPVASAWTTAERFHFTFKAPGDQFVTAGQFASAIGAIQDVVMEVMRCLPEDLRPADAAEIGTMIVHYGINQPVFLVERLDFGSEPGSPLVVTGRIPGLSPKIRLTLMAFFEKLVFLKDQRPSADEAALASEQVISTNAEALAEILEQEEAKRSGTEAGSDGVSSSAARCWRFISFFERPT